MSNLMLPVTSTCSLRAPRARNRSAWLEYARFSALGSTLRSLIFDPSPGIIFNRSSSGPRTSSSVRHSAASSGRAISSARRRPCACSATEAFVVGGALAMSSTAIVLKQLSEQMELAAPHGRVVTGVLLFQDVATVPLLAVLPVLAADPVRLTSALTSAVGKATLVFIGLVLVGRRLLPSILHWVAATRSLELFMLTALLLGALIAVGWRLTTIWRRRRRQARILGELEALSTRSPDQLASRVSTLLRRVALMCFERREVAPLTGAAWLAFLDRTGGDGAFTSGAGNVLATAPYRAHQVSDIDNDALIALARRWITQNLGRCG